MARIKSEDKQKCVEIIVNSDISAENKSFLISIISNGDGNDEGFWRKIFTILRTGNTVFEILDNLPD